MSPEIAARLQGPDPLAAAIAVIAEMTAEIAALKAQVAQLLGKTGKPPKTPENSGVPPSRGQKASSPGASDWGKKKRAHAGAFRRLADNPDETKDMRVCTCPHCAADVSGVEQEVAEEYDHVEIPEKPAVTTRVLLREGRCASCGKKFRSAPPADMPPGSPFGPNLLAWVIYMRQAHAVSFERLSQLFPALLGFEVSEGALASLLKSSAEAFGTQAARLKAEVLSGRVVQSDETGMRVGSKNWWLWVFQSGMSCVFLLSPKRSKAVVEEFLAGVRPEVWVSDRYASQRGWSLKHQACVAHLLRDAQYAAECGDTLVAPRVLRLLRRAVWLWHRRDRLAARCGTGVMKAYYHRCGLEMDEILRLPGAGAAGAKLQQSLLRDRAMLFVFLEDDGVPATNNASEQGLRPSVTFRKVTNCFRTEWGGKLHADYRSVAETARRRGIDLLDAIRLTLRGEPLPAAA